jgi:hypothetical protein
MIPASMQMNCMAPMHHQREFLRIALCSLLYPPEEDVKTMGIIQISRSAWEHLEYAPNLENAWVDPVDHARI